IPITITGYTRGPRITRYEFVQKAGIRVAKVASYADDITQKLSTQGVRIEAPIPNKSSIGVEVPNRKSPPVRIRSLLDTEKFRDAESKTTVAVGCDVTGTPVFFDIAKAPHMLIAGATGMGKSVCINSILISLLYKASPEEVRLILIDPKKVEFNVYSKVPHLLIPVVTDPNKAAGALNWAVNEMERRYDMIESASVRDIKGYNAYCLENGLPTLPKIVIVIDELNDLMMSARKMVEASICRIAQKARAAGIHLLIGTQRPSVNVITGDIKVNIPARIAFRVNQAVDSRTILDMQGAEKLLPHGDMLFSPAGTPQRVQGAFVEDEEVKAVTSVLAQNVGEAIFDDAILADIEKEAAKCAQKNGDDDGDEEGGGGSLDGVLDDPKFEQALDVAFSTGSISTSLLQRRIGVGFGRASRFIDAMCEMGIVGESRGGAKPREILLSRAEYEERKRRVFDD
ncbi:MAG: DNA translocase FtsK, partial [Clostridia bacterium]|nr:DNA translocase FtsK [Clostridia bacterium]